MAVKFAAWGNHQFVIPTTGAPASGYRLYTYVAGSSTPVTTYTTSLGNVQQSNPIELNSAGFPTIGQIWITEGTSVKIVFTDPNDVVIKTEDNIPGTNDAAVTQDQWVASGLTPTFVSTTSFTLVGDQTTEFHNGRRLKTTNSGGTVYSTITASTFGAVTTVVVANDSGVLDSGLSAVSYGLLSKTNDSMPRGIFPVAADIALYIGGLVQSQAADTDHDTTISTGACVDSTGVYFMRIASAITKQIDASWAVGTNAGGMDTGAVGNTSWYYIWLIARPDTGVVDALYSLSATAPTMPANYTYKRLIGVVLTNGSANIIAYVAKEGDGGGLDYSWNSSPIDVDASGLTTARLSTTLSVPTAFPTLARIRFFLADAGGGTVIIQCPDETDAAPSQTTAPGCDVIVVGGTAIAGSKTVRTSATGQIASRSTAAIDNYRVFTQAFEWSRR